MTHECHSETYNRANNILELVDIPNVSFTRSATERVIINNVKYKLTEELPNDLRLKSILA